MFVEAKAVELLTLQIDQMSSGRDGRNSTIAEVASPLGYKNPQHFTATFKKTFGYLPRDIKPWCLVLSSR
jgi:AraC-like DNA-binding protein